MGCLGVTAGAFIWGFGFSFTASYVGSHDTRVSDISHAVSYFCLDRSLQANTMLYSYSNFHNTCSLRPSALGITSPLIKVDGAATINSRTNGHPAEPAVGACKCGKRSSTATIPAHYLNRRQRHSSPAFFWLLLGLRSVTGQGPLRSSGVFFRFVVAPHLT